MTELWVLTTGWTLATLYTALREGRQSEDAQMMMMRMNDRTKGVKTLPVGSSVLNHTAKTCRTENTTFIIFIVINTKQFKKKNE